MIFPFEFIQTNQLLHEDQNLSVNNDTTISTTWHGTTIDAVFERYLNDVSTRQFASYFSYHKLLLTHMPIDPQLEQQMDMDYLTLNIFKLCKNNLTVYK